MNWRAIVAFIKKRKCIIAIKLNLLFFFASSSLNYSHLPIDLNFFRTTRWNWIRCRECASDDLYKYVILCCHTNWFDWTNFSLFSTANQVETRIETTANAHWVEMVFNLIVWRTVYLCYLARYVKLMTRDHTRSVHQSNDIITANCHWQNWNWCFHQLSNASKNKTKMQTDTTKSV